MNKLSIIEASKKFDISRARLYKLLEKGFIVGHRSMQRGRNSGSWVDGDSLAEHIENRIEKQVQNGKQSYALKGEGDYFPPREAAEQAGYTTRTVYRLMKESGLPTKEVKGGKLVHLPSLLRYKNKIH